MEGFTCDECKGSHPGRPIPMRGQKAGRWQTLDLCPPCFLSMRDEIETAASQEALAIKELDALAKQLPPPVAEDYDFHPATATVFDDGIGMVCFYFHHECNLPPVADNVPEHMKTSHEMMILDKNRRNLRAIEAFILSKLKDREGE